MWDFSYHAKRFRDIRISHRLFFRLVRGWYMNYSRFLYCYYCSVMLRLNDDVTNSLSAVSPTIIIVLMFLMCLPKYVFSLVFIIDDCLVNS